MLPSNIDVEYVIRKREESYSELPTEFHGIRLRINGRRLAWKSKVLLSLSDWLIRTGCAIKDSQAAVHEQRIYS